MTGLQKKLADDFRWLANSVEDGRYGMDENMDSEAILEDVNEIMDALKFPDVAGDDDFEDDFDEDDELTEINEETEDEDD